MFSYSVLSPRNFLSLKKSTRLPVLYRLVLFCLVVLFLSISMSAKSLAAGGRYIIITNQAPPTARDGYMLAKCDSKKITASYHHNYRNWTYRKCNRVFIVPVVNGKQLTKYAHTYNPASYCKNTTYAATYLMNMNPKPYTIHLGCQTR